MTRLRHYVGWFLIRWGTRITPDSDWPYDPPRGCRWWKL